MGFQAASDAAAGGTQQGMMYQFGAAAQQAEALRQAQERAAAELKAGREQGIGALKEGQAGALQALPQFYQQGIGYQQPYMDVGGGAVNRLGALYGQGGEYTQMPTLEQLQMDPSYAFRMEQGRQQMLNAARSGGLAGSGAALKAATRFGAGEASQEYGNAYNRFLANRLATTQALQGLAGLGANAAQTSTGLAGQTGANLANVYTGTGANIANTATGTAANLANTYANTGNQLANVYGGLGQGLAQGAANIGSIYAQGAMGPTNLLAALAGQGLQAGAYMYGRRPASGVVG
jgi:hypothetical protein